MTEPKPEADPSGCTGTYAGQRDRRFDYYRTGPDGRRSRVTHSWVCPLVGKDALLALEAAASEGAEGRAETVTKLGVRYEVIFRDA